METKIQKKTLSPEWGETFHVLVQEPTTQDLKVVMYNWEGVSLSVRCLLRPSPLSLPRIG
jgi:Ca2+-dependent lipid-binding protein